MTIGGLSDPDGDPLTIRYTSVFQDEPLNGGGDGNTSPDATLSPLEIRSERKGNGNGRVYTINFRATNHQTSWRRTKTPSVMVGRTSSAGGCHW